MVASSVRFLFFFLSFYVLASLILKDKRNGIIVSVFFFFYLEDCTAGKTGDYWEAKCRIRGRFVNAVSLGLRLKLIVLAMVRCD